MTSTRQEMIEAVLAAKSAWRTGAPLAEWIVVVLVEGTQAWLSETEGYSNPVPPGVYK